MDHQRLPRQNVFKSPRKDATTKPTPPLKGVLTRTLMPSSVIKSILPARIRHRAKNDVVLITEHTLELKELLPNGTLRAVVEKEDFGSGIRAARTIGDPGLDARIPPTAGIDSIIKQEASEEVARMSHGLQEAPPQILVLTLESDLLVFLFAYQDLLDRVRFVTYSRALFNIKNTEQPENTIYKSGKHIAVDPQSRAIAVAANERWFTIYSLKTSTQLKAELECNGSIRTEQFESEGPIREERHIPIAGNLCIILKIDFLYPPNEDRDHLILLVVVSIDGKTLLHRYEWSDSQELPTSTALKFEAHSVRKDEQVPLLLIPLTTSTGFMLVFEKFYSLYKNVLFGYKSPERIPINQKDPEEPGSLHSGPIWTQWARPVRHPLYANEVIYLCREDGAMTFIEFDNQEPGLDQVGTLEVNVDSAFTCLDNLNEEANGDLSTSDILAVGGNMSNGGLFIFRPRKNAQRWQVIPCWAPIVAFTPAAISKHQRQTLGQIKHSDSFTPCERIFACTGNGFRHGAICELRYGVEASSGIKVDLNELEISFVTGIWVFPHFGQSLFLITDPTHSWLLLNGDEVVSEEFVNDGTGFDMDTTTLTAGSTPDGLVLQVTPSSIRMILPPMRQSLLRNYRGQARIVAGVVQGESSSVITAVRNADKIYLHHEKLNISRETTSLKPIGAPLLLSSEPSCMASHISGAEMFVLIGTAVGTVLVLRKNDQSDFVPLSEHALEGDYAISDSFATYISTNHISLKTLVIICGLRNGTIHIFTMAIGEGPKLLQRQQFVRVGDTSVKVALDTTCTTESSGGYNRALIICGEDFCRLEYRHNAKTRGILAINNVILMDHDRPSFQRGAIMAIAQPEPWNLDVMSRITDATFFCMERSALHFVVLYASQKAQILPRRLPIGGTPNRIIHSKRLGKLVVAFTKVIARTEQTRGKRLSYPALTFIDPLDEESNPLEDEFVEAVPANQGFKSGEPITQKALVKFRPHIIGSSGERVVGLFEWYPEEDGKSWHLFVVNTVRARAERERNTGRMLLLELTQDQTGRGTFNIITHIKKENPIYAAAPYNKSSLVFCAGKSVVVQALSVAEKKWRSVASYDLPSVGKAVSTKEPLIYVTTASHSLLVLRLNVDRLELCLSDTGALDGLDHLLVEDQSLVLQSDKGATVTGLWQPPESASEQSVKALFRARLPVSITRLLRAAIKPPWRTSFGTRETIVGACSDGAVYQFDILDDMQWRFLRFIENMVRREKSMRPFESTKSRGHIEPRLSSNEMHVDGDLLYRLLDREPAESEALLRDMLDKAPQVLSRSQDFNDAATRKQRFVELLAAAVGVKEGEDFVTIAIEYLRNILETAL